MSERGVEYSSSTMRGRLSPRPRAQETARALFPVAVPFAKREVVNYFHFDKTYVS
jgi:hypothetical protein